MYQHQEPTQAEVELEYFKAGIDIDQFGDTYDPYGKAVIDVTNHPYFKAFCHSSVSGNIQFGDLALRLIAQETDIPHRVVRDIAIDHVRWDHSQALNPTQPNPYWNICRRA